jgi:hypothetical protein
MDRDPMHYHDEQRSVPNSERSIWPCRQCDLGLCSSVYAKLVARQRLRDDTVRRRPRVPARSQRLPHLQRRHLGLSAESDDATIDVQSWWMANSCNVSDRLAAALRVASSSSGRSRFHARRRRTAHDLLGGCDIPLRVQASRPSADSRSTCCVTPPARTWPCAVRRRRGFELPGHATMAMTMRYMHLAPSAL